jgi:hypothetical protein
VFDHVLTTLFSFGCAISLVNRWSRLAGGLQLRGYHVGPCSFTVTLWDNCWDADRFVVWWEA